MPALRVCLSLSHVWRSVSGLEKKTTVSKALAESSNFGENRTLGPALMLQAGCICLELITLCPETFHPLHLPRKLITPWSEVAQLCPILCHPMGSSLHQAPPSMGFSRQEYWIGLPFPSPTYCLSLFINIEINLVTESNKYYFTRILHFNQNLKPPVKPASSYPF